MDIAIIRSPFSQQVMPLGARRRGSSWLLLQDLHIDVCSPLRRWQVGLDPNREAIC